MRGLLLAVLLLPAVVLASPRIGYDTLASQHERFNTDAAVKFLPFGSPVTTLDSTFGRDVQKFWELVDGVRSETIEIVLINGTCIRNGLCQPNEFGHGYSTRSFDQRVRAGDSTIKAYIQKRALAYLPGITRRPWATVLVNIVLEHDLSPDAWQRLATWVREILPGVTLVNNPDAGIGIKPFPNTFVERHGNNPSGGAYDINSLDGIEASDIDIDKWLATVKGARLVKVWSRVFNCRDQGAWKAPLLRTACPEAYNFEELAHITEKLPPAPQYVGPPCQVTAFKSPLIWKPLAEDKGIGDPRANLPVALIPDLASAISMVTNTGKVIATLTRYRDPPMRYYSGYVGGSAFSGYGIERRAEKASKSRYTWMRVNRKCYGPLRTGRRQGDYR